MSNMQDDESYGIGEDVLKGNEIK